MCIHVIVQHKQWTMDQNASTTISQAVYRAHTHTVDTSLSTTVLASAELVIIDNMLNDCMQLADVLLPWFLASYPVARLYVRDSGISG